MSPPAAPWINRVEGALRSIRDDSVIGPCLASKEGVWFRVSEVKEEGREVQLPPYPGGMGPVLDFGTMGIAVSDTEEGCSEAWDGEEEVYSDYDLSAQVNSILSSGKSGDEKGHGVSNGSKKEGKKQAKEKRLPLEKTFIIRVGNTGPLPVSIHAVHVLPRRPFGDAVTIRRVKLADGDQGCPLEHVPESSISLMAGNSAWFSVTLMATQEPAFLSKYFIMLLSRPYCNDPLSTISGMSSSFMIGTRLLATFVSEDALKALSVEAKPFIPSYLKNIFDLTVPYMVRVISFEGCPHPLWDPEKTPRVSSRELSSTECPSDWVIPTEGKEKALEKWVRYTPLLRTAKSELEVHYRRLAALLWVEEAKMEKDMKEYDMFNVCINIGRQRRPPSNFVPGSFYVPGVQEGRPRLGLGSELRLRLASHPVPAIGNSSCGVEIIGVVTSVRLRDGFVNILLPPSAASLLGALRQESKQNGIAWHVRFILDRTGNHFMQGALSNMAKDYSGRFYDPSSSGPPEPLAAVEFYNCTLNEEQRGAVVRAVPSGKEGKSGGSNFPAHILFGPPGTGKSSTVVEAALQALKQGGASARVLLCAPSDTAADVLASRLAEHLTPGEMIRLNWWSRVSDSMPMKLFKFACRWEDRGLFCMPDPHALREARMVVCTCGAAGILRYLTLHPKFASLGDLPLDHFSFIAVDECSQATEAETCIPLSLAGPRTRVLLSGDPRQLGPTIRCPLAAKLGLGKPLQDRLMSHPLYSPGGGYLTMLTSNYRSHGALLRLPSKLFYGGETVLRERADPAITRRLLAWDELARNHGVDEFPMLFYGIHGRDMHEVDSPSFYNPVECSKILELVKALLLSDKVSVTTSDIGVICAFRKQVIKLRDVLRSAGLGAINVGQVEDFQGAEQTIIIVSTVLSERHRLEKEAGLGFLGSPKRFNVAMTRAMALVIVVGNAELLAGETYWEDVISWCLDHKTFHGSSSSATEVAEAAMSLRMGVLGGGKMNEMYPVDTADFYIDDPPWRLTL